MNRKALIGFGLTLGATAWGGYWLKKRLKKALPRPVTMSEDQRRRLLERVAPILCLPGSREPLTEILNESIGIRCRSTGRAFPFRNGVLDLLGDDLEPTTTQRVLDTALTAWAYDRYRETLTRLIGSPDFEDEVARIREGLDIRPGDTILDLACGHGNFTARLAELVGDDGLVIGLDISEAMLARAAWRVHERSLTNVLLIRGDALELPFADRSFSKVNCSGGFHQLPDLKRALIEIRRTSQVGARITASTFAEGPGDHLTATKRWAKRALDLNFVSMEGLGELMASAGYDDYQWQLPTKWFGYISATTSR